MDSKRKWIRPAQLSDVGRIAEILIFTKRTAYRSIFQDDAVSFGEMQVLDTALELQRQPQQLAGMWVYDDGIVRGMSNIGPCRDPDYPYGLELYELYVDPFFQGTGVGAALLADFLAQAKDGGRSATLWVLEENEPARAFYAAYGFQPDGERKPADGTEHWEMRYVHRGQIV